jgi:hypothetical protein
LKGPRNLVLIGLGTAILVVTVISPALGGPSLKELVKREVRKQLAGKQGPAGPPGQQGMPGPPGATPSTLIGRATSTAGVDGAGHGVNATVPLTGTTSWLQQAGELNMIVGKMQYDPAADTTCDGVRFVISTGTPLTLLNTFTLVAFNMDGFSDNSVNQIPPGFISPTNGEQTSSPVPMLLAPDTDTQRTLSVDFAELQGTVGNCTTDHHHLDSIELQIYRLG